MQWVLFRRRMRGQSKRFFFKWNLLLTVVFCFLGALSCGRKAFPLPPRISQPPGVENIQAELRGDQLQLSWPVPDSSAPEDLAGFYVYRAKEKSSDIPCTQCPATFNRVADMAYDPVSIKIEKNAVYRETLEKGYRYQYRVTSYSVDGDEGPFSKVVRIDY